MKTAKEKLLELSKGNTSEWLEKAKYRRANREWLRKSSAIAIKVLSTLRAQKLTQKDLAEKMKVSPQQVHKIVQGQENLTLETITKLEKALDIAILDKNLPGSKSGSGKNSIA